MNIGGMQYMHMCRYNMLPRRDPEWPRARRDSHDDDRQLLEGGLASFNAESDHVGRAKEQERLAIRENQRRFLLTISMGIPLVKFLLSCVVVFVMAYYDSIGNELKHHRKNGGLNRNETIYFSMLSYIPMSAISLMLGYLTFSKYPNVTNGTINHFLLYNVIVLFIQVCIIIVIVANLKLNKAEHLIAHTITLTEAYFLLLIKCCAKKRFEGLNDPNDLEMQTIRADPNNPSTENAATAPTGDDPVAGPSGAGGGTNDPGPSSAGTEAPDKENGEP